MKFFTFSALELSVLQDASWYTTLPSAPVHLFTAHDGPASHTAHRAAMVAWIKYDFCCVCTQPIRFPT